MIKQSQAAEGPKAERKTLTVPEAGRTYFGLERDAAYAAVRRGDIPVIKFGRSLRVPIIALERMLEAAANGIGGRK